MELSQYLAIARRWWWLLVASVVVGGGVAYGVSTQIAPTYKATATLLVMQRQTEGVVQLNDLQTSERLANTFSRLVTIRPVLEQAIAQGGLELTARELEDRLSVSNPRSTQLLEVTAKARSPAEASHIANTVAEVFIASNEAELTSRPGAVSIVERAEPPLAPVSPRKTLNAALGGVLALMAVTGLVLLIEYLDDTIKSSEQIAELTGLPTIARLEQFGPTSSPRDQVQVSHSRSTIAEAYRAARTHLSLSLGSERKLVLVTSPGPGEGKTTTVANLAVVFGLAGHSVGVVDTDLRRPMLHQVFGVDNTEGLTNLLLARELSLEPAIRQTAYTNVSVITSGQLPPNPSELLGSGRMQQILNEVKERFDIVLMDSPPTLVVTDASVLATLVDAVVVVVRANKSRTGALLATVEELAESARPIAGVVLNRVRPQDAYYYQESETYVRREEAGAASDEPRERVTARSLGAASSDGGSASTERVQEEQSTAGGGQAGR